MSRTKTIRIPGTSSRRATFANLLEFRSVRVMEHKMAMTADKCIEWLEGRIGVFLPSDDMSQGDISVRLPQIMTAAVQVKSGTAFGFNFPDGIRAESIPRALKAIERALDVWRKWLGERFGVEGQAFYDRTALNHGLTKPNSKPVAKSAAIAASFARLRARLSDTQAATDAWRKCDSLEDDEALGFAVAPPSSVLGDVLSSFEVQKPSTVGLADTGPLIVKTASDHRALPPELEALYAEMNGLWVGAVEPPGGERQFDATEDGFIFMPIQSILEHFDDREDGMILLNQHPDFFSWTMISPKDGGIYCATKLERAPRKVAASLCEYLDQLSEGFGQALATSPP